MLDGARPIPVRYPLIIEALLNATIFLRRGARLFLKAAASSDKFFYLPCAPWQLGLSQLVGANLPFWCAPIVISATLQCVFWRRLVLRFYIHVDCVAFEVEPDDIRAHKAGMNSV